MCVEMGGLVVVHFLVYLQIERGVKKGFAGGAIPVQSSWRREFESRLRMV
jgi:hypothetical protein